ncbi:MAG: saccharopine dehydrogenase family protein [Cyanobacteriota bacterium]
MKPILLYGATGFSGSKIARRLVDESVDLLLAGRHAKKLAQLGTVLDVPWQVVQLTDSRCLDEVVSKCAFVFNLAGPYQETADPVMQSALRCGVHYLDLAGEWPVFQKAIALDEEASRAEVMLLPGMGFTIAVSDCLLAMASKRFSSIERLRLAISSPDLVSAGTLKSMLGLVDRNVWICDQGEMKQIPVGSLNHYFYFGQRPARATAVNWPDVFTASRSTGVHTIEAFAEVGLLSEMTYRLSSEFSDLLSLPLFQRSLKALSRYSPSARRKPEDSTGFVLTVEAIDAWRRSSFLSLRTKDGYTVTTDVATKAVHQILSGHWKKGFQTPSLVFGADFIHNISSVHFIDAQ